MLVEAFVPGAEVALEGLLRGGALEVLALFDKPDPLDGPYFEETIYVTPSRRGRAPARIERIVADGARALGLSEGPLHAGCGSRRRGPSCSRSRRARSAASARAASASGRGSRSRGSSWRTRWGCRSTRSGASSARRAS